MVTQRLTSDLDLYWGRVTTGKTRFDMTSITVQFFVSGCPRCDGARCDVTWRLCSLSKVILMLLSGAFFFPVKTRPTLSLIGQQVRKHSARLVDRFNPRHFGIDSGQVTTTTTVINTERWRSIRCWFIILDLFYKVSKKIKSDMMTYWPDGPLAG